MQKEEYKESHVLLCIIQMQAYTYGNNITHDRNTYPHKSAGQQNNPTPTRSDSTDLTKQVQFLVIFKENIFLPKKVDYLLQLQKDVNL